MALINYKGSLGSFQYDNKQFSVMIDEQGEYMHYIGTETDGSKIDVPKGLIEGRMLFEDTDIVSQPELPKGLRSMDYMFNGCSKMLSARNIPDTVVSCQSTYSYCKNMTNCPHMPDSVKYADFMYDGCSSVEFPGRVSNNLETADCMYANCSALHCIPSIPSSVKRKDSIFLNCEDLPEEITEDYEDDIDYDEMFDGMNDEQTGIESSHIESNMDEFVANNKRSFNKKLREAGLSSFDRDKAIASDFDKEGLLSGIDFDF